MSIFGEPSNNELQADEAGASDGASLLNSVLCRQNTKAHEDLEEEDMEEDVPMTPVAIQRVGFWALVAFGCFVAAVALMWSVMRWTVLAGLVFATLAVVVRRRLRSLGLGAGAMAVLALSASIGAGHAVSHFEPFKQEFRDTYLLPQIAFGAGFVVAAVVIHRRLDVVEDQAILDVAIGAVAFLVAAAVAFFFALYFVIGPPIVP